MPAFALLPSRAYPHYMVEQNLTADLLCSTLDDPGVLSAMLPWRYFYTEHQHHGVRWSLCAREMCFKNELLRCVSGS
jgi:hypothetical protein